MNEEKPKTSKSIKKTQPTNLKRNPWKIAFLVLVGLVIGSVAFVTFRATQVREPDLKKIPAIVEKEGEPVVTIQSKKQQVNKLIDFYLANDALLNGTFQVLGHDIPFYLYFDPYVMANGNVQLKAKSLSIGTLGLPIKEVLKFAKRSYKLPKWVEINPDDQTVLLRLDQFRMQNGLFVRAEKINLVDDDIRMNIYLPKEK